MQANGLSFDDMQRLAIIAKQQAEMLKLEIAFSCADANGIERFYFSMPQVLLVSQRLARQKAYSAVAMRMPTHQLNTLLQSQTALYGLERHIPELCAIGGGFPCWSTAENAAPVLLGAIGISGGSVEQDIALALATAHQFSKQRFALSLC
ncbi:GlcG/HbpS family heme-binding protein [Testudinibacter sp. P27/CKL/0425]